MSNLPMKPKITSRLTKNALIVVVHLLVTHTARIDRRRIRILRIKYHRCVDRIHLAGTHWHRLWWARIHLIRIDARSTLIRHHLLLLLMVGRHATTAAHLSIRSHHRTHHAHTRWTITHARIAHWRWAATYGHRIWIIASR